MTAGGHMDAFLNLASHLADVGGVIARKHFRSDVDIVDKADLSPVTVADLEIEAAMRPLIEEAFPEHGIFGEEHGKTRIDAEYVWVLDPIDGTQGFVTGKPLFGSLIALALNGKPVVGVIDAPATGERWIGAVKQPTTFDGQEVRSRKCRTLADAWLYATSPHMFEGESLAAFERLRGQVKKTNYGADCYAYGLLANGSVDLVCEASLQPYDFMALVPVIEGAGGVITDWEGRALGISSGDRVLAAGDATVHAAALDVLGGA